MFPFKIFPLKSSSIYEDDVDYITWVKERHERTKKKLESLKPTQNALKELKRLMLDL